MSGERHIVLLDTHAILHRAYHALPGFTSPAGEPTGALYGLAAFILKIADELAPDDIIAAYDLPEPTHRHEAFAEYKGTRQKIDEELIAQIERSRDILAALAVPLLEAPGFEADDILGTLARTFSQAGDRVTIASGDMDTLQLVEGTRVVVYTLRKGMNDTVIYDDAAVRARYGFGPERVADFKGLRGDPSDNIPGVRGIGEKIATELITAFGSLDAIYEALRDPALVAEKKLRPRIVSLLTEGEDEARFSKELATIRTDAPVHAPTHAGPWRERIDGARAGALFEELGFRSLLPRLRNCVGGARASVQSVAEAAEPPEELARALLALWVVDSDMTNPTRETLLEYAGVPTFGEARATVFRELRERGLMRVYEDIELPLMPVVAAMEARGMLLDGGYLAQLSKRYHADLAEIEGRIYATCGGPFNLNSPRQLGEVLFDRLGIGAGKGKRTATGQRSTREDELRRYAAGNPIVGDILEYRELQKLLSTYIDTLPKLADAEGRLHAHFSQTGTTTGRMSSQSPNMQNIPIKTTRGAAIRRAIVAPEGFSLLAADYSQIELRVAAFLSGDEQLIASFAAGEDIHTAVAAQVFGVPVDVVDKEMRRRAKVINFGILYGMGAHALAEAIGASRAEAQAYLVEYFKRFSGIARYVEAVKAEVHSRGYTETWFGRRRSFPGIRSPLPYVQAAAERMALNAPIQGTQADIIKIAMVRIEQGFKDGGLLGDAFLTCQIHDELMFEVRDACVNRVLALVRETMQGVLSLSDTRGVPLPVEVSVGKNWGELTRV